MSNPFTSSLVRMQVPPGMGSNFSARGIPFAADADGVVEVPADLAAELAAHGLTPATAPAPGTDGKKK